MSNKLTHLDEQGHARMVDVSQKPDTERIATARGEVHMKKETLELIRLGKTKKAMPFPLLRSAVTVLLSVLQS